MSTAFVIVSSYVTINSQPIKLFAGQLLTDAGAIAAAQGAGVPLGDGSDLVLTAAAAVVARQRARGQNEDYCNAIMMAAFSQSSAQQGDRRATLQVIQVAAPFAATPMLGSPATRGGTVVDVLFVLGQTAYDAGESSHINVKKNGTSILTGAFAVTSAATPGQTLDKSSLIDSAQAAVDAGDEFTLDDAYVPGGTPTNPSYAVVVIWA